MIKALSKHNINKYKIAKACGVTWKTVQQWLSGAISQPSQENIQKLKALYNKYFTQINCLHCNFPLYLHNKKSTYNTEKGVYTCYLTMEIDPKNLVYSYGGDK